MTSAQLTAVCDVDSALRTTVGQLGRAQMRVLAGSSLAWPALAMTGKCARVNVDP